MIWKFCVCTDVILFWLVIHGKTNACEILLKKEDQMLAHCLIGPFCAFLMHVIDILYLSSYL